MDPNRVLLVDDEPPQLDILGAILRREGFEIEVATSVDDALTHLRDTPPAVILTDLKMPGRDGIDLLEETARRAPQSSLIIMTAHGTIDTAVEAMKKGAFDYLTKPLARDAVVLAVRRAMDKARLLRENQELRRQLVDRFSLANVIGDHGSMQEVFRLVMKVAPSTSTVLICGESGTGKELIARALHYNSPRAARPFQAINCSAIPESLLESELFGHERGSFTGAVGRKIGLFEEASGSTLFLDEVGDLGMATQARLLRALQQKEIRRVGGTASIAVDVRIVAATNRDLPRLIRESRFREDLYYRLNVVSLRLPPLRERVTDIPRLVEHFLRRHGAGAGKAVRSIAAPALAALMRHPWPGNVRQLESAIERAVLLAEGPAITLADLPQDVREGGGGGGVVAPFDLPEAGLSFEGLERSLLEQALRREGGNVSRAARLLRMSRRTFQYRLQKFGLAPRAAGVPAPADLLEDPEPAAPDGAPAAPHGAIRPPHDH